MRRVTFSPRGPGRSERVPKKPHDLAGGSAAPWGLGGSSSPGGSRGTSATRRMMLRGGAGAWPKENAMAAKGKR